MTPLVLRDEQVVLSILNENDLPLVTKWCQDPQSQRWLVALQALAKPYQFADAEYFLHNIVRPGWESGQELEWAIRLVEADTPEADLPACGSISLRINKPGARLGEIGFVVAPWVRGQGVASKALRLVVEYALSPTGANLPEVFWECEPGNLASWRVARNCGFRFDGVFPQPLPEHDSPRHKPGNWHGSLRRGDLRQTRPEYLHPLPDLEFINATAADIPAVMQLYKNLHGYPGCTWSDHYPFLEVVEADVASHGLYCLRTPTQIVGVVSVGINSDIADIDWPLENPIGLNRLAVAPPHQGYGYGQKLLSAGIEIARARGNDGVVLLVSPDNHAAIRLYERNGFQQCGEMFGWGFDWLKYYLKF